MKTKSWFGEVGDNKMKTKYSPSGCNSTTENILMALVGIANELADMNTALKKGVIVFHPK